MAIRSTSDESEIGIIIETGTLKRNLEQNQWKKRSTD